MATDIFTVTPLDTGIDAPASARELMRTATADVWNEAACTDAILLVSQLVTDAALGGAQRLGVTIRMTDDVLWAGVEATGAASPFDPGDDNGRRVQMLDLLASQWGVVGEGDDGAVELIWFEIRLDGGAG